MNFLVIQGRPVDKPDFWDYTNAIGIQKALKLIGHECTVWGKGYDNFNDNINFNAYDVILNIENYGGDWIPDLSKTTKPYKILWSIDAHVIGLDPFLKELTRGRYNKLCQATIDYIRPSDWWMPCSFDDMNIIPLYIEKKYDFGFCGIPHNRTSVFDVIKKYGINVHLDIGKYGLKNVQSINSYKVHLNVNLANDINIRNFETIACKTILLTSYNPNYFKLGFADNVNCFMYSSFDELVDKAKYISCNYDKLNNIIENAYELSKKHTLLSRMKHLIKNIENETTKHNSYEKS